MLHRQEPPDDHGRAAEPDHAFGSSAGRHEG